MKNTITFSIVLFVCISFALQAQVRFSGSLQSSVYTFDTPTVEQGNFYQGLQFKVFPAQHPGMYLNTYLRVAKQGNADWDERVYNLYAHVNTSRDRLNFRLGRQFLYSGVINGTMDGLLVSAKPAKGLALKAFVGREAPFSRELKTVGSDSSALGGYVSYRFGPGLKVDLSYFRRKRDDRTVWQLVGAAVHGVYQENLYYQAQLDHNLESDKIQGTRLRLSYYYQRWSLTGEYNFQKPRIFEDSFFRIFRQQEYQQFRGSVNYTAGAYQLGVQYLFTDHEFDQTNQLILNAGNQWGLLGLVVQSGYAGDNLGVYGDVRYPLIPNLLTLKLYASHYNFQRHLVEIDEDATAFSGGIDFRPWRYLSLQAEIQESRNTFYENDVRALFRVFYFFRQ